MTRKLWKLRMNDKTNMCNGLSTEDRRMFLVCEKRAFLQYYSVQHLMYSDSNIVYPASIAFCLCLLLIQTRIPRTLIHPCSFSAASPIPAGDLVHNGMSNEIRCPTFATDAISATPVASKVRPLLKAFVSTSIAYEGFSSRACRSEPEWPASSIAP